VKLVFKPAHSDEIVRNHLMEGLLDVAFIMDISKPEGSLRVEQLVKEEFKMVVASNYSKPVFSLNDLKDETFLLTKMGCSYRMLFENSLKSAGVFPMDKIEFSSIETIKQCVIAGLGVALLPEMAVKKDIIEGKMREIPWKGFEPSLFTQIAWHKDKWSTSPLEAFINLTRQIFLSDYNFS
jgi:DNA-binding transcriptional LysR family regulator